MARQPSLREALPGFVGILRHLSPWIRRERRTIAASFAAIVAGVLLRLAEPWPLKFVLDRVIPSSHPRHLKSIPLLDNLSPGIILAVCCVALILLTSLRALVDYWQKIGLAKVGVRILRDVRNHLYLHLHGLSLSFHQKARSGDLIVRVTRDISLLRDVMSTALIPLFSSSLVLVGILIIMITMQWQLTLLTLAVAPFFWISTVRIGRGIHQAARKQRQREGAMAASASESISAIREVQALSLEGAFAEEFSTRNAKSQKEEMRAARLSASLGRTVDILLAAATAMVMAFGGWQAMEGNMSAGDLVVFLAYLRRAFRPAKDLAKYTARLAKATAAGERVVEILDQTPEVHDLPHARKAPEFSGAVQFQGVSFAYEPGQLILENIDLQVPAHSLIAITGSSGCGKSTLMNLLPRLYDPSAGQVLIDGHDVREYTLSSLRTRIGVVLQQSILFSGSIADNIAFGRPDSTLEQVQQAARLASAHSFICALPEGYDTLVGERGDLLSQGQRQRIALARALIRNCPILILDEPTAGLDEENERQVTRALQKLSQQRTTFLVTHDLRSAAQADLVVFIEGGRIVEQGAPQQLLQQAGGRFANLFRLQATQGSAHDI